MSKTTRHSQRHCLQLPLAYGAAAPPASGSSSTADDVVHMPPTRKPGLLRAVSISEFSRHYHLHRKGSGIAGLEDLRDHLQVALKLELTTIPLYLCALYSMEKGANNLPRRIVRSVMLEEMLHMILVANLLNAIGGTPRLHGTVGGRFKDMEVVPSFPAGLPASKSERTDKINLQKFSIPALDDFMMIEKPAASKAPPEGTNYDSIGQFYAAIRIGLREWWDKCEKGDPDKQVGPEHYYGAGGNLIRVTDQDTAEQALDEIVGQGEGVEEMITSGDASIFDVGEEYAHYFRFNELRQERLYTSADTPASGPTGDRIAIDWATIYPMKTDPPKVADYRDGSELHAKALNFNRVYTRLLKQLELSFQGESGQMINAVGLMYELRYAAVDLMRIPIRQDDVKNIRIEKDENGSDVTAGPSFEFIPDAF